VYNCKVTNVVTFGHVVSEIREQTHKQIRRQTDRDRETDGRTHRQTDTCASSSMGVNATGDAGDTSPTIFGQPGTKHLIPPTKFVQFLHVKRHGS